MSEIQLKKDTAIERIIAKIDNDFNPDNSDWIPRVATWCIDAMMQLDVLKTKTKIIKIPVNNRIAYSDYCISNNIKVYDKNKCEIEEQKANCCNNDSVPPTGGQIEEITAGTSNTTNIINQYDITESNTIAETINDKFPYRYNVHEINKHIQNNNYNYVVIDSNKIELNFDTDYIYMEIEFIETYCSKELGCNLPVIPNNGKLIEAITLYCMYKMLSRGYKHPIFNLAASQYGTNPYYEWKTMKEEVRRSVVNDNIYINDNSELFRSNFWLQTFGK